MSSDQVKVSQDFLVFCFETLIDRCEEEYWSNFSRYIDYINSKYERKYSWLPFRKKEISPDEVHKIWIETGNSALTKRHIFNKLVNKHCPLLCKLTTERAKKSYTIDKQTFKDLCKIIY